MSDKTPKNSQEDSLEKSAWASSAMMCFGAVVIFLIVICVIEWQFNSLNYQVERLRLKMIRDLDRDNLIRIMNSEQQQ
jgi:hypothetical protein